MLAKRKKLPTKNRPIISSFFLVYLCVLVRHQMLLQSENAKQKLKCGSHWYKFKHGNTIFVSLVTWMTFLSFSSFAHFIIHNLFVFFLAYTVYTHTITLTSDSRRIENSQSQCFFYSHRKTKLHEIRMQLKYVWFTNFCCPHTTQSIFFGLTFSQPIQCCRLLGCTQQTSNVHMKFSMY